MLNESRARGSSAARDWRRSSAASASSIRACWKAETCCSAALVAAASESGVAGCGCGTSAGCAAAASVNATADTAVVMRRAQAGAARPLNLVLPLRFLLLLRRFLGRRLLVGGDDLTGDGVDVHFRHARLRR